MLPLRIYCDRDLFRFGLISDCFRKVLICQWNIYACAIKCRGRVHKLRKTWYILNLAMEQSKLQYLCSVEQK